VLKVCLRIDLSCGWAWSWGGGCGKVWEWEGRLNGSKGGVIGLTGLYDSRRVDCLDGWGGKGGAVS
jgi:hypothetical protein